MGNEDDLLCSVFFGFGIAVILTMNHDGQGILMREKTTYDFWWCLKLWSRHDL